MQHLDALVGGFPCQDLSVAGKRKGLTNADGTHTRSGLFWKILELADAIGQRWTILENVPGLLSSKGGNDFAAVVGGLAGINVSTPKGGWQNSGFALGPKGLVEWAILDAQFFGVAQRRRRVFIIRDSGNWRCRSPILLERESLRGDSPPRREKGEGFTHPVAPCIGASGRGFERGGDTRGQDPVVAVPDVADTLRSGSNSSKAHGKVNGTDRMTLIPVGTDTYNGAITGDVACTMGTQSGDGVSSGPTVMVPTFWNGEQVTQTLDAVLAEGQTMPEKNRFPAVLVPSPTHSLRGEGFDASEDGTGRGTPLVPEVAQTITAGIGFDYNDDKKASTHLVPQSMRVRRLTPVECERLQGFPDNHTRIPWRGKPEGGCPDGPRYKAIGNSMAVPVMAWIGSRIKLSEEGKL